MKVNFIEDVGMKFATSNSKRKARFWLVECPICSKRFEAAMSNVKSGTTTKCKSCSVRQINSTHGESKTKLYIMWANMKKRVYDKNSISHKYYGAEGIVVCDGWKNDYLVFKKWATSNGYEEGLSIDRIDVHGNYEPNNCRFVDSKTQSRNTRRLMSTNTSGYRGAYAVDDKTSSLNSWKAQITLDGKSKHLGMFATKLEAANAYDRYILDNNLEHTRNF